MPELAQVCHVMHSKFLTIWNIRSQHEQLLMDSLCSNLEIQDHEHGSRAPQTPALRHVST